MIHDPSVIAAMDEADARDAAQRPWGELLREMADNATAEAREHHDEAIVAIERAQESLRRADTLRVLAGRLDLLGS